MGMTWCIVCGQYVNSYCEKCGEILGKLKCQMHNCKGTMLCPQCGCRHLKEFHNSKIRIKRKKKRTLEDVLLDGHSTGQHLIHDNRLECTELECGPQSRCIIQDENDILDRC